MAAKKIGEVIHFFDKIQVAILKLTSPLKVGDTIKFKHGEDGFSQSVESLELDHKPIKSAKKGDEIGLKVTQPVKEKTSVLLD
jgi:putative protease